MKRRDRMYRQSSYPSRVCTILGYFFCRIHRAFLSVFFLLLLLFILSACVSHLSTWAYFYSTLLRLHLVSASLSIPSLSPRIPSSGEVRVKVKVLQRRVSRLMIKMERQRTSIVFTCSNEFSFLFTFSTFSLVSINVPCILFLVSCWYFNSSLHFASSRRVYVRFFFFSVRRWLHVHLFLFFLVLSFFLPVFPSSRGTACERQSRRSVGRVWYTGREPLVNDEQENKWQRAQMTFLGPQGAGISGTSCDLLERQSGRSRNKKWIHWGTRFFRV